MTPRIYDATCRLVSAVLNLQMLDILYKLPSSLCHIRRISHLTTDLERQILSAVILIRCFKNNTETKLGFRAARGHGGTLPVAGCVERSAVATWQLLSAAFRARRGRRRQGGEGGQAGRSALIVLCIPIMFDSLLFLSLFFLDEMNTTLQWVMKSTMKRWS